MKAEAGVEARAKQTPSSRPKSRLNPRWSFMLSGAAGVALAALVYFLLAYLDGVLRGWSAARAAEAVVFVILLVFSLLEIPLMVFGLRTLYRGTVSPRGVLAADALYVSFASFYAAVLVVLFGPSVFSAILASLCVARWASGWWIRK